MSHTTGGGGWRQFWLGLDRWVNTWFGGRSLETISARAGRAEHAHRWAAVLCWGLSWFERNHCQKAAHAVVVTPTPTRPTRRLTDEERRALRRLADKTQRRRPSTTARPTPPPTEAP